MNPTERQGLIAPMNSLIEQIKSAYAHIPAGSTIAVGMSGGVDSSVTAYLLQQAGYDIFGIFMQNWTPDEPDPHCTAEQDLSDAQSICNQLNIPLHTVNFSQAYWDLVFERCLDAFRDGYTPNPDVWCNRHIKFNKMLEHAQSLGADFLATGHYARMKKDGDAYHLLKGLDNKKDQSYFLYMLNQKQLSHAMFPLGELAKEQVRALAEEQGFITADKKDSTGICFIGERHFKTFLSEFILAQPGDMVSDTGEHLGRHDGLMFYTLGQRSGLNIGGRQSGSGKPWYVADKDIPDNKLIVVQGSDHPLLYRDQLTASHCDWINQAPQAGQSLQAKTRYRQADQDVKVTAISEKHIALAFKKPQFAITPGQSVVLYDDERCLGGALIDSLI